MLPPTPGVGAATGEYCSQQDGQRYLPALSIPTPGPPPPPLLGLMAYRSGLLGPRCPTTPPASPTPGVDGRVVRLGKTPQQLTQHPALPATSPNSNAAPSWASIVRDGGVTSLPPAATSATTTAEFFALYERCVSDGLRVRVAINHRHGYQEVTLSCRLPETSMPARSTIAKRRRRRHSRRRCCPPETAVASEQVQPSPLAPPVSLTSTVAAMSIHIRTRTLPIYLTYTASNPRIAGPTSSTAGCHYWLWSPT